MKEFFLFLIQAMKRGFLGQIVAFTIVLSIFSAFAWSEVHKPLKDKVDRQEQTLNKLNTALQVIQATAISTNQNIGELKDELKENNKRFWKLIDDELKRKRGDS